MTLSIMSGLPITKIKITGLPVKIPGSNKKIQVLTYIMGDVMQVKELESQLLIERRLARQHVDTKIAENQQQQKQKQKQQEPPFSSICTPVSGPLSGKNHNPAAEHQTILKEMAPLEVNNMLTDNNSSKPVSMPNPDNMLGNYPFPKDKENEPDFAEEHPQRKASRFSLYPAIAEIPIFPATRPNSLIPISRKASRVSLGAGARPSLNMNMPSSRRNSLIPLPTIPADKVAGNTTSNVSPIPHSPDTRRDGENEKNSHVRRSNTKLNSILRRSMQKKVVIRSPLPETVKRRTLAGLENVRVSIGGSGRMARRVMVRDGMRAADRLLQRNRQKDKERGWNHTSVRNGF